MEFLRLLESIRTPVLTFLLSCITYCGDEIFFMILAVTVFWCVSKRGGYYILLVGFLGTVCNQFLKLWFRIPRPWVLDPGFSVVESARAGATGYSFPSGHTQNIVGTMSCILFLTKQKWIRALCIALILLVPFSRMYLGCHTPLDVGVSFLLAIALAFSLRPLITGPAVNGRLLWGALSLSLVASLAYAAFVAFYPFPADIDAANLGSGAKNAATLLGCLIGLILSVALDRRFIHFEVRAIWWAQILKVAGGLLLITAIRAGLKAPLLRVLPEYPATAVRYCLMVLFAGAVWPLTFRRFAAAGRKKG